MVNTEEHIDNFYNNLFSQLVSQEYNFSSEED